MACTGCGYRRDQLTSSVWALTRGNGRQALEHARNAARSAREDAGRARQAIRARHEQQRQQQARRW